MLTRHMPSDVAPPFGNYAHGIEVPPKARWLVISGQVGVRPDGDMAQGIDAQCEQAWRNLMAVLSSAGMGSKQLVKVTVFLTDQENVRAYRRARDLYVGDATPASTLVVVSGLADPTWLVEIEALAAQSV